MKGRVIVFYKESVFDPQGNTVGDSLRRMGFQKVQGVRVGKIIDIELNESSPEEGKAALRKMADKLLANPVIESYQCEIL